MADTKKLFDGLKDHWVCPGCSTDVMTSIAQQVEFVEEGVVGDLGPIEWGSWRVEGSCSTVVCLGGTADRLASCL